VVDVRPCRPDEIEAVLAVWDRCRSEHAVTPDSGERVAQLVAADPEALQVAECDGELIGTVIGAWDGWRGNFYRLAVLPEHRRAGIGRRLVEAAEERLRGRGAPRITALVAFDDVGATAFWEAAGYARDPVMGRMVRTLPAAARSRR
jgi:ribosomal protein S18 acetylase RimI-like enzyme